MASLAELLPEQATWQGLELVQGWFNAGSWIRTSQQYQGLQSTSKAQVYKLVYTVSAAGCTR